MEGDLSAYYCVVCKLYDDGFITITFEMNKTLYIPYIQAKIRNKNILSSLNCFQKSGSSNILYINHCRTISSTYITSYENQNSL